jgi:hypothetical protein
MSCSKKVEDCMNAPLDTYSLEELYECENTKRQMDINLSESFTIITTQSRFSEMVTGTCKPEIDFEKYDLIIGKKGLTSGNVSIDYDFRTDCENDRLLLTITFNQNITTEAPNLTYHVLVDKLNENENVEVIVEVIN